MNVWLKAESRHACGAVNCWVDQTTNGNHAFYQEEATVDQPVSTNNALNGRVAIYFAGSNAFHIPPFGTNWTQGEVFVALRSLGNTNVGAGLWLMGPGLTSFYPNTNGIIQENFGCSNSLITGVAITNLGIAHVYNITAKAGAWTNRLNGATQFSTNSNTVLFSNDPRLGLSAIGPGSYGVYVSNQDFGSTHSIIDYRLDFYVQAVPEPSTFSLLLVGAGLVGLRCRRNLKRVPGPR